VTTPAWFDGDVTDLATEHDSLRPLMFSIAYRMLGSVAEAEDVVQDAFLRIHTSLRDGLEMESPDAFATTVTSRLAIDALRSARHRREQYVGTWLPEPLLGTESDDPAGRVEMQETISTAFLVLLERLTPLERAVFLLREAFGYDYADIAEVVDKSEANCRQILARARKRIEAERPRFEPSSERHRELTEEFLAAVTDGDLDGLERMLADDVVFYADGGGKAPAIQKPLHGATSVARFLLGLVRRGLPMGVRLEPVTANAQPAVRLATRDGEILGVLMLEIVDGRVVAFRNQINPDKLGHLGPVGDMFALLAEVPRG
jgi:RNA polymerase sigma-70 factor (TIGR02957 family)